ncbi:Uncharacterized protein TCAP_01706 [Tolypocladium capitatum]|uniref:Nephrocystin 3-like N-terminal domain-containing protein n=1 Tax=Tolypocladium capitatum TaxID=45235 RepID=A0A2K3QLF4_9HYPO|nr:Uncharacterized protein TCAP_01706 [Tolypocladium capitatum]
MGKKKRFLPWPFRTRTPLETGSDHSETQRLVPSSGSSLPVPSSNGAEVLYDSTDVTVVCGLTGNRDSNRTTHVQSEAEQRRSPRSCQALQADPRTESTSEACSDQAIQPHRVPGKHNPPPRALWEEAADSLDPENRKKLDHLIKCKREDHAADPTPKRPGESSTTEDHWGPSVTDDVNMVLSRAERLREDNKEATWQPVVNKIVDKALKFKSLGDAAVKYDKSGFAALGWLVVSYGLRVAANVIEARKFVLDSSEVVTGYITRYAEYEKAFRGPQADQEFDRRLTDVYKAILLHVMALDNYLQKCNAGHLVDAVFNHRDRSISDTKAAIEKADKEVQDWLPIIKANGDNEKFSRVLQRPPEPQELVRDCLQSLAFIEMEDRSHGIDSAVEGTYEWLSRHEAYTSWAACDTGLLWIRGKPGSGKSTLLRYALNNVMTLANIGSTTLILSFFFHGRGAELQRTPLGFFRSLLHQVLIRAPETLSDLVTTFKRHRDNSGDKWQWHPRELLKHVKLALPKVLKSRSILLFVDALDECGEENAVDLVGEFKSLLQGLPSTGSQFGICFSCRHYPILDLDYGFEICLERENAQDISTYVQTQLSSQIASTIPASIRTTIQNGASGIFMWARLAIERILLLRRRGFSWKKIEAEIHTIPAGLDELYQELVHGMDEKPASLRLLQWICFATRSLSLNELRWAMVVDETCPHKSLQQCQEADDYISDSDMMEIRLKTLSRGLAETVPSSDTRVVQFIHQSAKDFFIDKGLMALYCDQNSTGADACNADLVAGTAHYRLSRSCIRYLAMEELAGPLFGSRDEIMSKFPLLHYATSSWVSHAKKSEERNVSQADLLDYFVWPSEAILQQWVLISSKIDPSSCTLPNGTSLVHIASQFQMTGLLQVLLQRADLADVDIDAKDENGQTPFSLAARSGYAAFKLLLDTGRVDIDAKDHRSQTPLFWAAANGQTATVKLLLDTGKVDIDAKNTSGVTPFSIAATNEHIAIVQLLLDTGNVDIDAEDASGQTPFSVAVAMTHISVAKLLLDTGKVDVNAKYNGRALLLSATCQRRIHIVKLLLDSGKVDVDTKDRYGWTPLFFAATIGCISLVELLLNTGKVNVDTKDTFGYTPLVWAVRNGHVDSVKLLLDGGADPKVKDPYSGQTLLLHAIEKRKDAIVKLLLDTGKADIDARDPVHGLTPLLWAVEHGKESIVQLLLSAAASTTSEDSNGQTPLILAIQKGYSGIVKLLLEHGADKECGWTALQQAGWNANQEVESLLLSAGAIAAPDFFGLEALFSQ